MTKVFCKTMAVREEMCNSVNTFNWLKIRDWGQAYVHVVIKLWVMC
jgi:hypothetical protein